MYKRNNSRNLILALVAFVFVTAFYSCSSNVVEGQLTGVERDQEWNGISPLGMSYIPSGTFMMGQSDQDINFTLTQQNRSVSVQGFYMDNTEITNSEYRQFSNWVRDSIALTALDQFIEDESGNTSLDWDYPIDWMEGSEDAEALNDLFYQGDDMLFGKKELNPEKIMYKYRKFDMKGQASSRHDRSVPRSTYITEHEVEILPDNLCWVADFSYSYNEPMAR